MRIIFILLLAGLHLTSYARTFQMQDSVAKTVTDTVQQKQAYRLKGKAFILPAALITYGILGLSDNAFGRLNKHIHEELNLEDHHKLLPIDNFTQFAPAVTVFCLQAFGVKGIHSDKDELLLYAMSIGITGAVILPSKKLFHQLRPDGSGYYSFPSGHTAMAFASAEFLYQEYRDASPWIWIAGYTVAAGTGFMRMYNNRHWLGDVVAGAGIGIASTKLAYWLHDKIFPGTLKKNSLAIYPSYQGNNNVSLCLIKRF